MNSRMKVLHIISDIHGTKVYDQLIKQLDQKGVEQTVYCTLYKYKEEKEINFKNSSSKVINAYILTTFNRYFLLLKIWKAYRDIVQNNLMQNVDVIHCHSFFTSSTVGYLLAKKYNIKFIISFRSTDINLFIKKYKLLNSLIKPILKKADNAISINYSFREFLFKKGYLNKIEQVEVIPNGIDDYWLENIWHKKNEIKKPFRILFVGKLIPRKNFSNLYQAYSELKSEGYDLQLNTVGIDDSEMINYKEIKNFGYVKQTNELKNIYREHHVFAMPSYRETFGLVYLEALTQGLPLVYTKGQGIDGYFSKYNFGEAVEPESVNSIKEGLKKIIKNYTSYNVPTSNDLKDFSWDTVSNKFIEVYKKALDE